MNFNTLSPRSGLTLARITADIYTLTILLVFPLFTGLSGYKSITFSKFLFFALFTFIWLLSLAALFITDRIRKNPAWFNISSLSSSQWAVLSFMLIALISALCSPYGLKNTLLGAGRYDGLISLLLYCFAFLGVSALCKPRRLHILAVSISVLLCSLISILQLLGFNPLNLFPNNYGFYDGHTFYTGQFLGTIGNTNLLSGFFSLGIPLLLTQFITGLRKSDGFFLLSAMLGLAVLIASNVSGGIVAVLAYCLFVPSFIINNRRRFIRAVYAAAAACLSAAAALSYGYDYSNRVLTLSFHLSAPSVLLLGLCLFMLTAALFLRLLWKNNSSAPAAFGRLFALLSVAIISAAVISVYYWPGDSGTVYELKSVLHGDIQDEFGSSRIRIWRAALDAVPDYPLLGSGPDTLSLRLDIEFSRFIPERGKTVTTYVDNAHNEYIGYLINLGALGLTAYLAAIFLSLLRLILIKHRFRITAPLGSAVFTYAVQSFFGLGLCLVSPIFWTVWGLLEAGIKSCKTVKKPAALGFFDKGALALRGAFGNGSGK